MISPSISTISLISAPKDSPSPPSAEKTESPRSFKNALTSARIGIVLIEDVIPSISLPKAFPIIPFKAAAPGNPPNSPFTLDVAILFTEDVIPDVILIIVVLFSWRMVNHVWATLCHKRTCYERVKHST